MRIAELRDKLATHGIKVGRRALINAVREGRIEGKRVPALMSKEKIIYDIPETEVNRIIQFMKKGESTHDINRTDNNTD